MYLVSSGPGRGKALGYGRVPVGELRHFIAKGHLGVCWRQGLLLYSRSRSSIEMPICLRIARSAALTRSV
jgi:hypothetical protein